MILKMYGKGNSSILDTEADPEAAKSQKKDAVREEKEKVLTQLSLAEVKKTATAQQQIKGITQASRQKKKEIYSDGDIIPLGDLLFVFNDYTSWKTGLMVKSIIIKFFKHASYFKKKRVFVFMLRCYFRPFKLVIKYKVINSH